ncbi:MAG TPA: RNase H family protein [Candidatus Paceibacterota bacterium]
MMKPSEQSIIIYTDGASSGNPGPGGWGTLVVDVQKEKVYELGDKLARTTNNETELMALLEGLRKLSDLKINKDVHIYVYLDSQYVRNGVMSWMKGWIRNDWITSTGEAVKNKELWMALNDELQLFKKLPIEYIHVNGHVGVLGNERVNDIAQGYAQGKNVDLYEGPLGKYSLTVEQLMVKAETTSKKTAKKSGSAGGWYLSIVDGKLEKHTTWTECEARVKGKLAKFKKVSTQDEEDRWTKANLK